MWALPPPPSPAQQANERCDGQARHDASHSREPAERFVHASAIISVETTRRSEFPNLVRGKDSPHGINETALQFAERVKQALIRLQGGF